MAEGIRRHFRLLTEKELLEPELLAAANEVTGLGGVEWPVLLEHPRVLILAEAGSGKTHELRSCRERLSREGKPAFFLPLEALADEDPVTLIDEAQRTALADWRSHDAMRAWFLLDSVDELKLSRGKFDRALERLARTLDGAMHRASVIVTSRPSDWRPRTDLETFQRILPVPPAPAPKSGSEGFFMDRLPGDQRKDRSARGAAAEDEAAVKETVQSYMLLPLSERQIRTFAVARKLPDADAFIEAIGLEDAWTFARRPLDLIDLIEIWRRHQRLGSRTEQLETDVSVKLRDKHDEDPLSEEMAREGAARLALALALTRRRTLRTGEARVEPGDEEALLDPADVLADWSPKARAGLLRRAMFDPATYGRVRFHHRSVAEFLAADRLHRLSRERGMDRSAINRLLFARSYGIDVVLPSMRPIAAWLAGRDDAVREEVLLREPELLLLEGDPAALSLEDRIRLLDRLVEVNGTGGWRRLQIPLDASRRISCRDLVPTIRRLWLSRPENVEVTEFLLELVWAGRLADAADIALEAALDDALPANHRTVAIRALVTIGDGERLAAVASSMLGSPPNWEDRVVLGSIAHLFPGHLDVTGLLTLLRRVGAERDGSGLMIAMREIVRQIDPSSREASALRDGLADLLLEARLPESTWHQFRSSRAQLGEPLAALVMRQVDRGIRPDDAMLRAAFLARQFSDHDYSDEKPINRLEAWLRDASPALRSRAFWIQDAIFNDLFASEPDERLFRNSRYGLVQVPQTGDAPWLEAEVRDGRDPARREIALRGLLSAWRMAGATRLDRYRLVLLTRPWPELAGLVERETRSSAPSPVMVKHAERDWRARNLEARRTAKRRDAWMNWRRSVLEDPEASFSPEGIDLALARLANWLRARSDGGRDDLWNRQAVVEAFGLELANRFGDAFTAHWRTRVGRSIDRALPTDERLTEREWVLGFVGLAALAETPCWADGLDGNEARSAAVFGLHHINQFPAWFAEFAASRPEVVDDVVGSAVCKALRWGSRMPHLGVLQHVAHGPEDVRRAVAPRLCEALERWPHALRSEEVAKWWMSHLGYAVRIVARSGTKAERERATRVCRSRLVAISDPGTASEWLAGLFRLNGVQAVDALIAQVELAPTDERRATLVTLLSSLDRGHRSVPLVFATDASRTASLLRAIRFTYGVLHPSADPERPGPHSVGPREEAEWVRDFFVGALFETPGLEAWRGLMELADEPAFDHFPDRLRRIARERAAKDADGHPLDVADVVDLERLLEAPPNDTETMFAMTVGRIAEMQEGLRHDDFTNRRTLRRVEGEPEMQVNLAGLLRGLAREAYRVVREDEAADGKKTDIRLIATRSGKRSVIEIKMADERWSAAQLRSALELQLVQLYLRPADCRAGVLLLVDGGERSRWTLPDGAEVDMDGLVDWLRHAGEALMMRDGHSYRIETVALDLRDPVIVDPHRKPKRANAGE